MYVTTTDVVKNSMGGRSKASMAKSWHGLIPMTLVVIMFSVAFFLDASNAGGFTQEEQDFHMARSGFSCYMRLYSGQELICVQLPLLLAGSIISLLVLATTVELLKIMAATTLGQERTLVQVIRKFKPLRTILALGINALITLLLWICVSVLSAPEFQNFIDEVGLWYECKIFDYSQSLLYGEENWSSVSDVDCGLFPEDKPSVNLQIIRYLAEVYVPLTVALSFGVKRSHILYKKTRKTVSRKNVSRMMSSRRTSSAVSSSAITRYSSTSKPSTSSIAVSSVHNPSSVHCE